MKLYDEEILTTRQVSEIFNVDATTVRRWVTEGCIASIGLPSTAKPKPYTTHRFKKRTVYSFIYKDKKIEEGKEAAYLHSNSQYAICKVRKIVNGHVYIVLEGEEEIHRTDLNKLAPLI